MVQLAYLSLAFLLNPIHECSTLGFTSHPQNISVKIGGTAYFECIFDGPDAFLWVINGIRYAYGSRFPQKHMTDDSGNILTVTDVELQFNGNSYQCITSYFQSLIGFLFILPDSQYTSNVYFSPTLSIELIRPTAATSSAYNQTRPAILATSMLVGIATRASTISTHTGPESHQLIHGTIVTISATASGVFCCCGLLIMLLLMIIKVVQRSRKKNNIQLQREPEVVKNEAYDIVLIRRQAKITIKPNAAYAMVELK